MTRALICTGVLGGGTAVVFALALAASVLFPQGSLVPTGWNGGWGRPMPMLANDVIVNDVFVAPAMPVPAPAMPVPAPMEAES